MGFKSFQDIIEFAIGKEDEAALFYEDAAAAQTFSGPRDLFLSFAAEERKHAELLRHFETTDLSNYPFAWIPDLKRSNYLVDISFSGDMSYRDMLHLAIKKEEKSLALYRDLYDRADRENLKTLFKMLRQEEAKHKLALETLFDDYMAGIGD